MNKKERNIIALICLIIIFSVINAVIVFGIHIKNIDATIMTDAEKVVYLINVLEKYTYYSMFWLSMLTMAFISLTRCRGKNA